MSMMSMLDNTSNAKSFTLTIFHAICKTDWILDIGASSHVSENWCCLVTFINLRVNI